MRKLIIITFLLLSFYISNSQEKLNYKQIDSATYQLYLDENWQSLEKLGIRASKSGLNFYYLNIRTGLAAFNLGNYLTAEKYFKKALKNNSTSEFAKEYLFWIYYNLGEKFKTNDAYKKLSPDTKLKINHKRSSFFDFIFLEYGNKYPNQPDSITNNVNYFSVGMNHFITPNFTFYESYTRISQTQNWGSYVQQEAFANTNINLHNNLILSMSVHISDYKSNIDFLNNYNIETTHETYTDTGIFVYDTLKTGYDYWKGTFQQQVLVGYIGFSQRICRFKYNLSFHFMMENQIHNYYNISEKYQLNRVYTGPFLLNYSQTLENDSVNYNTTFPTLFLQPGLEITFLPKSMNDGVKIGCKVFGIITNTQYYILPIPFLDIKLNKYISVNSEFMQKGNYPFVYNQGSMLLNNYNNLKTRFTLGFDFKINKDLNIYTTYLYEDITENFTNQNYKLNSFLIGIKLNF